MRHRQSSLLPVIFLLSFAVRLPAASPRPAPARAPHAPAAPSGDQIWWKHALLYEIYPRSFQDSDGNGIGDLNGIVRRLGYLENLGVNAVWLSPIYPSPQVDFGYDISNYEAIDPMYGTMADFDRLLAAAKQHHIRVIMDFVLNHTSDQHPWFLESRSSRNNPRRDWYIWNSGRPANSPGVTPYERRFEHNGMVPPNNWESLFGGSAWQWDPRTKQFYYHKFYAQQPDLNWRNPQVRKAMYDVCRFWLDKGVAGFRLDALETLFEDPELRDEKILPGTNAFGDPNEGDSRTSDLPEVHDVMRELRSIADSYPGNRVLVGEAYTNTTRDLLSLYGAHGRQLQLPMDTQVGFINKLDADEFRQKISEAENELDGHMPLFVFDNHDNPRSWDRYGDGRHDEAIAKLVATVLLTTRSVALMYYGQEIGMVTTPPKTRAEVQDPIGKRGWPKEKGRDGERTPMQWNASNPQAGFSTDPKTWLPVPPNYKTVNVQTESAEPDSLLSWYKKLIALRASNPALHEGGLVMLDKDSNSVLAFERTGPEGSSPVVVAVNMSGQPQTVSLNLPGAGAASGAVHTLAASDASLESVSSLHSVTLPPFASWVASVR